MKKTLIAIAAIAASSAFAQSSVTISGQFDAGYAHTTATTGVTTRGVAGGIHGASRLRFVGTEDMGGGSKANFWLEMQPSFADGTVGAAGLFNRGAWLGLQGGWGELRFGRQGTNTIGVVCTIDNTHGCYSGFGGGGFLATGNATPTSNVYLGQWFAANPSRGLAGINALASSTQNANQVAYTTYQPTAAGGTTPSAATTNAITSDGTRYVKALRYSLPSLAKGLDINTSWAYGNQGATDGSAGGGSLGLDVTYASGPLKVAGAYQKAYAENSNTAVVGTTTAVNTTTLAVTNTNIYSGNQQNVTKDNSGTLLTLAGFYDAGAVQVGLGMQRESAQGLAANLQFNSASAWGLSAFVPMGAWTPYAKIGNKSLSLNGTSTNIAQIANIGTRYALSKRTNFFADFVSNNSSLNTVKPKQLSAGIQHNF